MALAPYVVVASDSFKGSASSAEVNQLIADGVRRACPGARVDAFPLADGGEGTLDALLASNAGTPQRTQVHGSLGQPVSARWGLLDDGATAVLEMAEAAGIGLSDLTPQHALEASTFGVGELLRAALDAGVRRIYVGLGGSATSDGGSGMARALGARLLDASSKEVPQGLSGLAQLARVDTSGLDPRLASVDVVGLTDVNNPLCGPRGAVHVYGPQKGIPREATNQADSWMAAYARALTVGIGRDVSQVPGAGAAGGLGAGLLAFCGARLVSGVDFVLHRSGMDQALAACDLAITGEGRMDAQSAFGKAPVGVARLAKRHGVPVVAVVGSRAQDLGTVYDAGIDLVLDAVPAPMTLEQCLAQVRTNVPLAAESAMRAFMLGRAE